MEMKIDVDHFDAGSPAARGLQGDDKRVNMNILSGKQFISS